MKRKNRIEARIERLAAREFTQEKLDAKLTEMLGSEDRNWLAIDLPLNFHPLGIRALWVDTPIGAG